MTFRHMHNDIRSEYLLLVVLENLDCYSREYRHIRAEVVRRGVKPGEGKKDVDRCLHGRSLVVVEVGKAVILVIGFCLGRPSDKHLGNLLARPCLGGSAAQEDAFGSADSKGAECGPTVHGKGTDSHLLVVPCVVGLAVQAMNIDVGHRVLGHLSLVAAVGCLIASDTIHIVNCRERVYLW